MQTLNSAFLSTHLTACKMYTATRI